jgi:hypothetical protein
MTISARKTNPLTDEEVIEKVEDHEAGIVRLDLPEQEVTDLGDYCVECRKFVGEDTEWFATRQPVIRDSEDGTKRLKGFLCDDDQPIEGTLMEPIIDALKERRFDERQIRTHMKRVGPETLFEELVAPMLDMLETLLQLERK